MTASDHPIIRNVSTGVPGLDAVLGSGLCEYSFNLIAGAPGSGKTTLVQQILFANATPERRRQCVSHAGAVGTRFPMGPCNDAKHSTNPPLSFYMRIGNSTQESVFAVLSCFRDAHWRPPGGTMRFVICVART